MIQTMTTETHAQKIRRIGTSNWCAQGHRKAGLWFFNTHHHNYQVEFKSGVFRVYEPYLIEMTDAQFERHIELLREARSYVQASLEAESELQNAA